MSFDPITAALDLGKAAISRIWPDPVDQAREVFKLEELKQKGDLAELNAYVVGLQGQLRINEKEAGHSSIFVAGWRPAVGWVCAASLGYNFFVYPLLLWIWSIVAAMSDIPTGIEPPPMLEMEVLMTLLLGMLGIGAQRSFDKKQGRDTKKVGK